LKAGAEAYEAFKGSSELKALTGDELFCRLAEFNQDPKGLGKALQKSLAAMRVIFEQDPLRKEFMPQPIESRMVIDGEESKGHKRRPPTPPKPVVTRSKTDTPTETPVAETPARAAPT